MRVVLSLFDFVVKILIGRSLVNSIHCFIIQDMCAILKFVLPFVHVFLLHKLLFSCLISDFPHSLFQLNGI